MGMNMWGCQASVYTPNHITDPHITDKSFYAIYHAGHDPFHYVGKKKTKQTAPEGPVQYIKLIWVIQVEWQQRIKGFGGFEGENCKNPSNSSRYTCISLDNDFFYNKCIQYPLLKYFVVAVVSHFYRAGASAIWRREAIEQATGSLSCSLREVLRLSSVFFLYVWVTATVKNVRKKSIECKYMNSKTGTSLLLLKYYRTRAGWR